MSESRIWTTRHLVARSRFYTTHFVVTVWDRKSGDFLDELYHMPDLSLEYMNEWAEIIDAVTTEVMAMSRKLKRKGKQK